MVGDHMRILAVVCFLLFFSDPLKYLFALLLSLFRPLHLNALNALYSSPDRPEDRFSGLLRRGYRNLTCIIAYGPSRAT